MATSQTNSTNTFDRLYTQLNVEQKQAVDAVEGVVIVLAGPGTGKTQILAMRIANILRQTQMDPYNILCLTFTESGVAAMRKRLLSIIGEAAYYVRIHTFHSFCNDIIQEFPEKFTFARELEVLSDLERVELFREIIDHLPGTSPLKPFGDPYLFIPDITRNVQSLKKEHLTPETYGHHLEEIQALVKVIEPEITTFSQLSPKERTTEVCTALLDRLEKLPAEYPRLTTYFKRLQQLHKRYDQNCAVADSGKEISKLNTKLKNDLKRWFEKLYNQLPKQQALQQVYAAYQEALQQRGRYDYEDMILFVIEQFKMDDELLAHYQEQFQYILVDEYQDTNGAQNETIFLLGQFSDNPNIFVVGDDKQSIYRFQGASLQNLLFLYEKYGAQAQVITLKKNYRSQQTILDAAYGLISHNQEAITKYLPNVTAELTTVLDYPRLPVTISRFETASTERYGVGQQIQSLITDGIPPSEIAVLYRRNADAADMAEVLLKLGIPVQVEQGDNVLHDPLIHQMLELLRYLTNPQRMDWLWRIIQFEWLNLSAWDVLRIQAATLTDKTSLLELLTDETRLQALQLEKPAAWQNLAKQLASWQQVAANRPLPEFLTLLWEESGYLTYILTVDHHVEVLNRVNTLFSAAKQLARRNRAATVFDFLHHLDLLTEHGLVLTSEPLQTSQQAVRLMTAHKSKGLEFQAVFVIYAVDHHWGNLREHSKVPLPPGLLKYETGLESNEDERRLLYVALTRAKKQLFISYADQTDGSRAQVPSIFLNEIPTTTTEVRQPVELEINARERLKTLTFKPVSTADQTKVEDLVRRLLESYTLSVTHLNAYLNCPRLFYYRHLLRVPSVKTKHMAFGTAIHEALYTFFKALTPDHVPEAALLQTTFAHALAQETLTEAEAQDALAVGQTILADYFEHYEHSWLRQTLLEYDFRSHQVTVEGIPLTGKIDKIEVIDPQKRLVNVVDYKTGNPDTKSQAMRAGGDYQRQLVFYKLLCDSSPRFKYTMQTGEIDFLQRSPKTKAFIKKKFTITPEDVAELTKVIVDVWQRIQNLQFIDPQNPDFCGQCEYCQTAAGQIARL